MLSGIERALRSGGRLALSAFSAYFQVRHLDENNTFEAATGVHHERTVIKNEAGDDAKVDAWTTCYTPRELRLLVERAGLIVDDVFSVEPGRYARNPPAIDTPEFLVLAHRS